MFCWALCLALSVSVKPLNIKHICPHNAGFSVGKRGHWKDFPFRHTSTPAAILFRSLGTLKKHFPKIPFPFVLGCENFLRSLKDWLLTWKIWKTPLYPSPAQHQQKCHSVLTKHQGWQITVVCWPSLARINVQYLDVIARSANEPSVCTITRKAPTRVLQPCVLFSTQFYI